MKSRITPSHEGNSFSRVVEAMKKIEAMIRPEKIDEVKSSLEGIGVIGMTSYEIKGRGQQKGLEFVNRAGKFRVDMLSKMKLELIVDDKDVQQIVETICKVARTGEIGDGKIFVIPMENVIRIRTGEEGPAAL